MSKSKKNVIDPESMIKEYGADAVRWFILSDSPPEKDVQWSNQGVNAAYKFLQKIYNLNILISNRSQNKNLIDNDFNLKINSFLNKVTNSIENFNLNVVVANVYEIYNLFNTNIEKEISNECLKKNIIKLMKILIPFVPHLANECLEIHKIKDKNEWPIVDKKLILEEKIKLAIQIDGKTRDIIEIKKNLNQNEVVKICKSMSKVKNKILEKEIKKVIFVENRIINFIF